MTHAREYRKKSIRCGEPPLQHQGMGHVKRPVSASIRKGDLVKRKAEGGHVMTVIEISNDAKAIIGSYTTPDGERHDEHWKVADLKRIAI